MKFVHFSCLMNGCSAEGYFVIPDDWKTNQFPIFCPHCGKPLDWDDCSIEEYECTIGQSIEAAVETYKKEIESKSTPGICNLRKNRI